MKSSSIESVMSQIRLLSQTHRSLLVTKVVQPQHTIYKGGKAEDL